MKRGKPLQRGKRVNPRNPARRSKAFARCYGSEARVLWMSRQPCCVCGYPVSENVHTRGGGMGRKADADTIVPMCRDHHRELHQSGTASFELAYGIRLSSVAHNVALAWRMQEQHFTVQESPQVEGP